MLIQTMQDWYTIRRLLSDLRADEQYAIDTETTGLRPWKDTVLRGISLYIRGETFYVPVSHPGGWNIPYTNGIKDGIQSCKGMPIFHNANFDRAVLESSLGIDMRGVPYRDTQVLAWLQDENRPKGLKPLGEIFYGLDASEEQKALKQLMKGTTQADAYKQLRADGLSVAEAREQAKRIAVESKRTWADLTAAEVHAYAEQDARLTYQLFHALLSAGEYRIVEPAVQRMHDLQDVVYRMVRRGVQIDPEQVVRQRQVAQAQMTVIREQFTVNLDSPKELAKLIYGEWDLPVKERTDSGQPSTARATLEAMAGSHPGLDQILQYRRLGKAVGTYFTPFLDTMDEAARIHPHVNVVGTVTGRFAYSDPNLQTIPRDGTISGIKDCFVARPGKCLVSYDLKSAELRFMASLAGEQGLIEALEAGVDVYQLTADRIGTTRQVAKSLVLSWPYGVGPVKFSRASGLTVKESRSVIADFEATYSSLTSTMSKLSTYAELNGRLPLLGAGRFRRFVGPHLPWPVPGYTALNAACQGGVADFMGDVMIAIEDYADAIGAEMVLQVHDSLVFEVEPGTQDLLCTELHRVGDELNPLSMPLVWTMTEGV